MGIDIAIVVGGGNIVRGGVFAFSPKERVSSDHMGMLATVINALALNNALLRLGINSVVFSAISMPQICESFAQNKVLSALDHGKVVIFAGGTGNPYFTTDTAATLRAIEIGADVLIKATQVDGVYDSDPRKNESAKHLAHVSYSEAIQRNLAVMDMTAITLAKDNKIPILVYSLIGADSLCKVLRGEGKFSIVN